MSVEEISALHNRYLQLSDRFKSLWTYHQFVQSVFQKFLAKPLPYRIDFQSVWSPIKESQELIRSSDTKAASDLLDKGAADLKHVTQQLLIADEALTTSVMRRFFEKLGRRDEMILLHLIRFYLSAESIEGDRRDKLDFLLTRLGEAYVDAGGDIGARDSLTLRQRFQALAVTFPGPIPDEESLVEIIRQLKAIRGEIENAQRFEDLTNPNLVGRLRQLKHESGNGLFHPDVMLAVVNANVAMKKRFSELYQIEEQNILKNVKRVLENEDALRADFARDGESPSELDRLKEFKGEFDESRASSNVKVGSVTRIKESLYRLLGDGIEDSSGDADYDPPIEHAEEVSTLDRIFGDDPIIQHHIQVISQELAPWKDRVAPAEDLAREVVTDLRLEPWEIAGFFRLYREEGDEPQRERDLLYVRSAALRQRINDEARAMLRIIQTSSPGANGLRPIRETLAAAERADASFGEMMALAQGNWSPENVRHLHRSRLRLFREFSGLWLIYDQHVSQNR